jgi:hypothetical protein
MDNISFSPCVGSLLWKMEKGIQYTNINNSTNNKIKKMNEYREISDSTEGYIPSDVYNHILETNTPWKSFEEYLNDSDKNSKLVLYGLTNSLCVGDVNAGEYNSEYCDYDNDYNNDYDNCDLIIGSLNYYSDEDNLEDILYDWHTDSDMSLSDDEDNSDCDY